MLNLTELLPVPWKVVEAYSDIVGKVWEVHGPSGLLGKFLTEDDANAAALAHNAFDVMMRRGWHPTKSPFTGQWCVWGWALPQCLVTADDPITALVEADKWYKENVEKT